MGKKAIGPAVTILAWPPGAVKRYTAATDLVFFLFSGLTLPFFPPPPPPYALHVQVVVVPTIQDDLGKGGGGEEEEEERGRNQRGGGGVQIFVLLRTGTENWKLRFCGFFETRVTSGVFANIGRF